MKSKLLLLILTIMLLFGALAGCGGRSGAPRGNGAPLADTGGATTPLTDTATTLPEAALAAAPVTPEEPPDYNVGIYGYLEALAPTGQTVTYWHADEHAELRETMIDAFNRTNVWEITVESRHFDIAADLRNAITTSLPTLDYPTLAVVPEPDVATYTVQGALVALDPYVESARWGYDESELDAYYDHALEAGMLPLRDARYGWPRATTIWGLAYNQDWLQALGYEAPPETWETFGEMACQVVRRPYSKAVGDAASTGYVFPVEGDVFLQGLVTRGGDVISESLDSYLFNGPAGAETVNFLRDLARRGCARPAQTPEDPVDGFGTGRALFAVIDLAQWNAYNQAVRAGARFDWGIAPLPHSTAEPQSPVNHTTYVLFDSQPEAQLAAWYFVKWLEAPEQQAWWIAETGALPTRQQATGWIPEYVARYPYYAQALDVIETGEYVTLPQVAGYAACHDLLTPMLAESLNTTRFQTILDTAAEFCNMALEQ